MAQTLVALLALGLVSAQAQYLGVPQNVVSSSLYPFRTAIDTLVPSVTYGGLHYYNYPAYTYPLQYYQPYYGYDYGFRGYPALAQQQATVAAEKAISGVITVGDSPAVLEAVEVGLEAGVEGEKSPAIVTVSEHIDALPEPPRTFGFRGVPEPALPAGIVQATQPKFVQVPFKNSKLGEGFKFAPNSKVSPFLTELREQSAGIIRA